MILYLNAECSAVFLKTHAICLLLLDIHLSLHSSHKVTELLQHASADSKFWYRNGLSPHGDYIKQIYTILQNGEIQGIAGNKQKEFRKVLPGKSTLS